MNIPMLMVHDLRKIIDRYNNCTWKQSHVIGLSVSDCGYSETTEIVQAWDYCPYCGAKVVRS